ncbi:acyl-CoA dehydrogenase fadE16 [Mycobacterium tuberculosis]|nr:acyl-CoA dehydrogenase fadE16 [Mycobacterium tuberculosis]
MGSSGYDHEAAIADVIERTAASQAGEVDRAGVFPRGSIEALAGAGLLGLTSGDDVGGRGEGLAAAAHVIERLGGTCGSTAMILLMHYAATAILEVHGPK